ncbi:hypothetical protein DB346_19400 [Verrucomicrobia bacterium LW23]|nr:hypothetical protein DB346_19400 [Verrucomicrobia bacterium LW23]
MIYPRDPRDRGLTPGGSESSPNRRASEDRMNQMLERLHRRPANTPPPYAGLLPAQDVEQALAAARRAAEILRRHGAARVLLFGSLAREYGFTVDSDINLAEEGIPEDACYQAYRQAAETDQPHPIHVVDLKSLPESQRSKVLALGRVL